MNEDERLQACKEIAERMYLAGMVWNYDAIEKFTRPESPAFVAMRALSYLPEPTPVERGVLDRYQSRRQKWHR